MAANIYDLGDLVHVTSAFTYADLGGAVDPDVVSISVREPNEKVTTYVYGTHAAVERDDTGEYSLDIDADQSGIWYYRWFSSGDGQAAQSVFTVREAQAINATDDEVVSQTSLLPWGEYHAEYHIGLVAEDNSPTTAALNTTKLNAALLAMWSGGAFEFPDGTTGPVVKPIRFPGKEFFFTGTIKTNKRIGGALLGPGGRGYMLHSASYGYTDFQGGQGGAVARLTRIDGETGGGVIRLRGAGFIIDGGIEIRGREYFYDPTYGGPDGIGSLPATAGTRTTYGIEIEGNDAPSTGRHVISNCAILECTHAIAARDGYYNDANEYQQQNPPTHADNCIVSNLIVTNCNTVFRNENLQAVMWKFRDIEVNTTGAPGLVDATIFDLYTCGDLEADGLSVNHLTVTLLKVHTPNANAQRITCTNLKWDQGTPAGSNYICLFQYVGDIVSNMSGYVWTVRVTGDFANSATPIYDTTKLIQIGDGAASQKIPRTDLLFDVTRMPTTDFTILGDGPWYYPTP